jgi:hypothetical protein
VFWAARDAGASSDEVAAEITTVVVRRARFRDMTRVDMKDGGARRKIQGPGYPDGKW